ncbi:Protein Y45F10D.1 [Phytophthora palmivora]|uniref:Protein Y45F10D.1 n=1 Tax=Phytophthora palmivora TaxID=4796 RepID=A0A2P4XWR0_9STRA|nr:Protein Y45F10D.1 [Phytophthora palmivora]
MGRGSPLTERERCKIDGLGQAGVGIREIARKVKRSTDAVRPSTGEFTAPQLRSMLNLTPSVRTIQRVLVNVVWLCYTKLNSTLPLSKADKISRKA